MIRYCETKQLWRKIVIHAPLLSLTFFDTRIFLKHRRVPLRNFSALWDKIFSTENRDTLLHKVEKSVVELIQIWNLCDGCLSWQRQFSTIQVSSCCQHALINICWIQLVNIRYRVASKHFGCDILKSNKLSIRRFVLSVKRRKDEKTDGTARMEDQ